MCSPVRPMPSGRMQLSGNSHLKTKQLACVCLNRLGLSCLSHWGRETHICVGKLTIIASDNGLSPRRRRAIFWTNAERLLIGALGTNFNEILIEIHTFSFKKIHLKMSSAKWRPFCLGPNVLSQLYSVKYERVQHISQMVVNLIQWGLVTHASSFCSFCRHCVSQWWL